MLNLQSVGVRRVCDKPLTNWDGQNNNPNYIPCVQLFECRK